jgi:hypothetical protein
MHVGLLPNAARIVKPTSMNWTSSPWLEFQGLLAVAACSAPVLDTP